MSISNGFLDRAIAGLKQGNVWITHDNGEFGIRKKDFFLIRIIKNFARNFGYYFYSNIQAENLLGEVRRIGWIEIDPAKARDFLRLFNLATKGRYSRTIEEMSGKVSRGVEENKFQKIWTQRGNGIEILASLPRQPMGVIVENQDFSVNRDGFGGAYICKEPISKMWAHITQNNDHQTEANFKSDEMNAQMLEQILVKAFESVSDESSRKIGFTRAEHQKFMLLTNQTLGFKMKNPNQPLPLNLEQAEVDFEGFKYKLEVSLDGTDENFIIGLRNQDPSLTLIGKKEGRADKKVIFSLSSKILEKVNDRSVETSSYNLKKIFFDSNVHSLISAFCNQALNNSSSTLG